MRTQVSISKSLENHRITKAVEHLLGMVEGMIVDNHLHDLEVKMLSTWLTANPEAATTWPVSVIARKVSDVLTDGIITEPERKHLMEVLKELIANNFSETGSASSEATTLPIDDCVTVTLKNSGVCMTGEFIFGTRTACERLTLKAGGMPLDNVTKHADILVIGTRLSPDWAHTTFGRKIQRAAELRDQGHPIEIISERRWLEAVSIF